MLSNLSEDVIWRIFQYLDARNRARLASINSEFYALLNKWEDVLYCSVRLDGITLAGEEFIIELGKNKSKHRENFVQSVLIRCPLIRKFAIHDIRAIQNVEFTVLRDLMNVDELYISSNFFVEYQTNGALIESLFSFPKLHKLHIQQRYSEPRCHLNIIHGRHVKQLISTSLCSIKLQGVTVTSTALRVLCSRYRRTLESLCLMGALVPSQDLYECFEAINSLDRLAYLTLAPSLYSISSSNKEYFKIYPSLKNCETLKVVALYVSKPSILQLELLLCHILPCGVEQLLLYDESCHLKDEIEKKQKRFNCKVHFCRDDDIIIDNYWTNGKSELITHSLWKPPYKTNIYLSEIIPEWYCLLSDLMDTAQMNEPSCSSSSVISTAQDLSELDEHTCVEHSSCSILSNNESETVMHSMQSANAFSEKYSFDSMVENNDVLDES